MNGGVIATIAAVLSLVLMFLLGRKSGVIKENEELRQEMEVYKEKKEAENRNAETKAESAEKKSELATKVAAAIIHAAIPNNSIDELAEQAKDPDADAIELARQQAQRAQEFMQR